jgi:hypothetical protein
VRKSARLIKLVVGALPLAKHRPRHLIIRVHPRPVTPTTSSMSMIGAFLLVTEEEIQNLVRAPEAILPLVDSANETRAADFLDIDQTWQCLHFLLTGTAWEGDPPLNFIVAGGTQVGEEDIAGYGPARSFTGAEVREIANALDAIAEQSLGSRFDGAAMDELDVYPDAGSWSAMSADPAGEFGYYSQAFNSLKTFVRRARDERKGMVTWLT